VVQESIAKVPNQELAKQTKYFSFFFLLPWLNIAWTSHVGLCTNSSILYRAVHNLTPF